VQDVSVIWHLYGVISTSLAIMNLNFIELSHHFSVQLETGR
jgi:hypothetical protein